MTKPQFSEPSMEDILASIRKMISEERLGPRPIPDQIGRSPFGESIAESPAAGFGLEPRSERTSAPAERSQPSFSSLSDALKAAAPAAEQRRTLEEKIADMLETGDASPRPATPTDSLAVFAANRPTPAPSLDPGALSAATRSAAPAGLAPERTSPRKSPGAGEVGRAPKPASRLPEAPLNGATHRREEGGGRAAAAPVTPKVVGPASGAELKKAETQRIIAMPPRPGASGAGQQAGTSPAGSAMNGVNVSSLGLRPFPGSAQGLRPTSTLRDADAPADKSPDTEPHDRVTAKSTDDGPAKFAKEPQALRDEATTRQQPGAKMPRPADAASPFAARATGDAEKSAEAAFDDGTAKGAVAARSRAPSDALVDAVVALVHKEPDTLSVFTSGSAFIHGVSANEHSKPGPNVARKLDRSAAELLRPMLRQWLSENMPRIVEEALRSELINSESAPKDTDEA